MCVKSERRGSEPDAIRVLGSRRGPNLAPCVWRDPSSPGAPLRPACAGRAPSPRIARILAGDGRSGGGRFGLRRKRHQAGDLAVAEPCHRWAVPVTARIAAVTLLAFALAATSSRVDPRVPEPTTDQPAAGEVPATAEAAIDFSAHGCARQRPSGQAPRGRRIDGSRLESHYRTEWRPREGWGRGRITQSWTAS
jgi:hypothetical protein